MQNEFAIAASPNSFINPRLAGSYNDAVFNAQSWAKAAGFEPGALDGRYGGQTRVALNAYLADTGQAQTGTLTLEQYKNLAAAGINAMTDRLTGTSPDNIIVDQESAAALTRDIEIMLKGLGYDAGSMNGSYDAALRAAIVDYQQDRGLALTGEMTAEQSQRMLSEYTAEVNRHLDAATLEVENRPAPVTDNYQRLVFYGDSIAVGIGGYASRQRDGIPVANFGEEGAGLYNQDYRLTQHLPKIRDGDLVIVSLGSNDMAEFFTPRINPELPNSFDTVSGDEVIVGAGNANRDYTRNVQAMLNANGIAVGGADGVYGSKTQNGIMEYQRRNGMEVTGNLTVDQYRTLAQTYEQSYEVLLSERLQPYKDALESRLQAIIDAGGQPALIGLDAENYNNWSREQNDFNNNEFNDALAEVAERMGIPFIDRQDITLRNDPNSDGLHGAYGKIYDLVIDTLTELQNTPKPDPDLESEPEQVGDMKQDQIAPVMQPVR